MFNKNLKKENIVKDLAFKTGYSLIYSKKLVEHIIEIIINNVNKSTFNIKNIGTFKIIKKKERIGRNPKTKEKFIISARKNIRFKISQNILKQLDKLV